MSFLLVERARSEGARSMRAVNDNLATPLRVVEGGKVWIWAEGLLYSRNARPQKEGGEQPDHPSCSPRPHDQNALPRCAQWRTV
jgi:hypothetical protein